MVKKLLRFENIYISRFWFKISKFINPKKREFLHLQSTPKLKTRVNALVTFSKLAVWMIPYYFRMRKN